MGFNGAFGDTEFSGDLFVEQPGHHQPHNLELSWRELRKSGAALCHLSALFPFLGGAGQRLRHGREKFLIRKWFWQEIYRSAFHGTDCHWYIAVSGDEYDLLYSAFLRELLLKGGPVEAGHPDIKDETRRTRLRKTLEVFSSAGKGRDGVFLCREQGDDALPNRGVVIHNEHAPFRLFHPLTLLLTVAVVFIIVGLSQ
jgi:hypothetical protein